MLRKNSKITFGGMWVFLVVKLTRRITRAEGRANHLDRRARRSSAGDRRRSGITVASEIRVLVSLTPPPVSKSVSVVFVAKVQGAMDVAIDDGEIKDHAW